ncbi:MAG: GNAT family protein [Nocardioides sp.]
MLSGERVTLRPVREGDLDEVYAAHLDLVSRGDYFPLGVLGQSPFRAAFADTGFWQKHEGTLLMVTAQDRIIGNIEFFTPVSYWDAFELSYQLFDTAAAGRGVVTEAVRLLVDYLFATKKQHRIHLAIVPENIASQRVAQKCGFQLEGTVRGAFFNDGRNQDVLLYSLLRTDPRPWRAATTAASTTSSASVTAASASVG